MLSFDDIWQQYYTKLRVYGRSFSRLSEDDIEDAVQDIMITVHRRLTDYDPTWAFSTWIYRIARNRFIDFQRKNQRRNLFSIAPIPDFIKNIECSHDETAKIDRDSDLARALNHLSDTRREIFFWFYGEDMSIAEISAVTGMSQGTVKSHLHRGRRILAAELEEDYG
jgi:RNA polymerase sigma-70 factor (ECF subfamily)